MRKIHQQQVIARLRAALIFWVGVLLAPACLAGPWIEVGDERTRHHLQYLKDTGVIHLPLTTWPLAWADVGRELNGILLDELSDAQLWSYRYLRHTIDRAKRKASSIDRFHGSNSLIPVSYYGSDFKEASEISSETSFVWDWLAINIDIQSIARPSDDDDLRFDGSYIATTVGNWIIGAGALERWWGPGWHSSLILSNNARPAPGLFLRRKEALKTEFLPWLGSWNFEIFGSTLERERAIPNAKIIGSRFSFSPINNVEIGHSRVAFWGGNERIENLESLYDLVLINDVIIQSEEENNFADVREESNQLISYDARINLSIKNFTFGVYGQYLTNEEQSFAAEETANMLGIDSAFAFWGIHHQIAFEMSDTRNEFSDSGLNGNPIYDHISYEDGYRHKNRAIGESAGTNALKYSALGDHYLSNGHEFHWRYSRIEANEKSTSNNYLGSAPIDQEIVELKYKIPLNSFAQISAGIFSLSEGFTLQSEDVRSGGNATLELRF